MSTKPSKYQAERERCVDLATRKAAVHGESTWSFDYRKQEVLVTARSNGNSTRISTSHVKNKGK